MPQFNPCWRPIDDRRVTFIVPGSIKTRTGGYEYDRSIIDELCARRWLVDVCQIDKGRPLPPLPEGKMVVVDGLALDSIPGNTEFPFVVVIHMPGSSGSDERAAMNAARAIVVTGVAAQRELVALGVEASKIAIVEPGTLRPPAEEIRRLVRSRGDRTDVVQLLSVGNVTRGKGHDRIVMALQSIPERNWSLTIAGSLARDPAASARLLRTVADSGLDGRIALAGELDMPALGDAFAAADVFVLATLHETYGMAVAEAIAWHLPVVSTSTGEIPAIVGDGGIVVPPGDDGALALALSAVLRDPMLRARLSDGARTACRRLRTWYQAGDEFSAILERVAALE